MARVLLTGGSYQSRSIISGAKLFRTLWVAGVTLTALPAFAQQGTNFFSYPPAAPFDGTEVMGPVRQGITNKSVTMKALAAASVALGGNELNLVTNYGVATGIGAAVTNCPAINSAMLAVSSTGGSVTLTLPGGDFYFNCTLIPQSGVRLKSGAHATLHYTGIGTAVENSTVGVLDSFAWDGIKLDAGNAAYGIKLHSANATTWDFGEVFQTNATGTFMAMLADNITGAVNLNGNRNTAFNVVRNMVMSGNGSYTGTHLFLGGLGTNTAVTGVVTLNTFFDIANLDVRQTGVEFGHWSDSNSFLGRLDFDVNASNATCLWLNSSSDTLQTVYNEYFSHVSCSQYVALTGTTGVKIGAARGNKIELLHFDENSTTQFANKLTIDPTNTGSYEINTETGAYGVDGVTSWRRLSGTADGPTTMPGLTQNLPVVSAQKWNNAAIAFSAYEVSITDTTSAVNSAIQQWRVNGTVVANIIKNGALNLLGGITAVTGAFTGTVFAQCFTTTVGGGGGGGGAACVPGSAGIAGNASIGGSLGVSGLSSLFSVNTTGSVTMNAGLTVASGNVILVLPTSCTGLPTNALRNNAGVVSVCP